VGDVFQRGSLHPAIVALFYAENAPAGFIPIFFMVNKELIQEFREITKAEYGLDLSFEEANNIGNDLVDFFDTLAKIDSREKYKKDEV